jgi:hypothetical protein
MDYYFQYSIFKTNRRVVERQRWPKNGPNVGPLRFEETRLLQCCQGACPGRCPTNWLLSNSQRLAYFGAS